MKRTVLTFAAALLAFSVLAQEQTPPDQLEWFHDANLHFSLLRGKLHSAPPLTADQQREFRGRCLEVSTEYNKRAASVAPAWFKRNQLPATLSAQDCA